MKWLLPLALAATTSQGSFAVAAPRTVQRMSPPLKPGVTVLSSKIVGLLRDNNTKALSTYVDSSWGLRFSPEVYARKDDVKLTRRQVAGLRNDKKIRIWGEFPGEDGPMRLNWAAYRKDYVWSRNFLRGAQVTKNSVAKQRGTLPNNLHEFYPNATCVEFYLPPTSKDRMDWQSLWLVWKKKGTTWRLIGIAHGEWTS